MKNDYTNQNSELNKRPAYLEDYEIEVNLKKKSILFSFFYKFKEDKKLLYSGNDKKISKTNMSINSMWIMGDIKTAIFKKLDYFYYNLNKRNKKLNEKNNIEIQIIEKSNIVKNISTASKKLVSITPIIPKIKNIEKLK